MYVFLLFLLSRLFFECAHVYVAVFTVPLLVPPFFRLYMDTTMPNSASMPLLIAITLLPIYSYLLIFFVQDLATAEQCFHEQPITARSTTYLYATHDETVTIAYDIVYP